MEFSKYKIQWLLLCEALLITAVSILGDIFSAKDTIWFARSGAILVLFAAIVEYRLSSFLFDDIHQANVESAAISSFEGDRLLQALTAIKPKPPKSRAILAITSHVIIIIGTFVWGYGDLIIK